MLLTIQQLSDQWQVSPDTIRRHIASGKLAAINLGTGRHQELRISADDAKAFIENRKVATPSKYTAKKQAKPIIDYLS